MEFECYLCATPGAVSVDDDHGNRHRVACQGVGCGRYVITNHAIRRLAEGGPNKEVLCQLVNRANSKARLLDIFVAADGLVQATEIEQGS